MWRAIEPERLEAVEAADAVVDVDDDVAHFEVRRFGDEGLGPPRTPGRPGESVAEDILLAEDHQIGGLETVLKTEDDEGCDTRRQVPRRLPAVGPDDIDDPVIGQHAGEAVARAPAVAGDHHPPAGRAHFVDTVTHGVEQVDIGIAARGSEVGRRPPASLEHRRLLGLRRVERRELGDRAAGDGAVPFVSAEIEPLGRQRPVDGVAPGAHRRPAARREIVGDRRQPGVARVIEQRIETHRRRGKVVEQGFQAVVEQR